MKAFGEGVLYELFLLSEKVGTWSAWLLAPVVLALIAGTAWLWAAVTPAAAAGGLAAGLLLLALSAGDLALFRALPRRGLSFGPVLPAWLLMAGLRCGLGLAILPLATRRPAVPLAILAVAQVLLFLLLAHGTLVEPFRLQVRRVRLSSPKLANPGTPVRIVQLSDLHVERTTPRERALPGLVQDLQPDVVLLTGDYLNTSYRRDPKALSDLRALLAQIGSPAGVIAIWGTPKVDFQDVLRPVLEELGIILLEDQAREVIVRDHRLWLIGLNCEKEQEIGGARLRSLLARVPEGAFTILLHHSPDLMPEAARQGVDLVLSGHTHGGQWCLPWFGALHTSSRYWKRYEGGYVREGSTHLCVSRGLGMEGFGMPRARFFCPPEVVLVTLEGTDEALS
ncbi:MAG TPA: metallophosphoesterase [Anaerolineae bacterium]|nr:metallophosphoesterase [Anaerolineae bacterium]